MTQVFDCQRTSLTPATTTIVKDISTPATPISSSTPPRCVVKFDIEHALVEDDPRLWSRSRKNVTLFIVSGASMIVGFCANIQNPANSQIERDLHATASQISLSLSLFILFQGCFPLVWSTTSEIKGRKFVYLLSIALFIVSSGIAAGSGTIGVLIGMRVLQGAGASAVLAIGAATLADIYEPHERGTMMGVYYTAPLLGPAIGPILGGGLTQGFNWRAVFSFLAIWGGLIFFAFLFLFKDTYRKERSLTYQNLVKRCVQDRILEQETHPVRELGEHSVSEKNTSEEGASKTQTPQDDVVAESVPIPAVANKEIKLSITDINPFPPYVRILRRRNNVVVLIASGLFYAFSFCITYTCARTLSLYYGYNAMAIGLMLLSYGIGCVIGSVLGGRWSDRTLARLKAANGGVGYPEMRLESIKCIMWLFPPAIIGYAWVCQERVHVAAICAMLFLSGFCLLWIYASTLAYIVDANAGRSSSAIAVNSLFRGVCPFVATEIAVPLQDAIGDGGLYTLFAGLMLLAELMLLLVLWKGKRWREASIEAEIRM